jgi:hypothetical protein
MTILYMGPPIFQGCYRTGYYSGRDGETRRAGEKKGTKARSKIERPTTRYPQPKSCVSHLHVIS